MHVENAIVIQADLRTIYELAAAVEYWPARLPHYRWVRVLEDDGRRRLVEMAARRDGIPVWWCAEQVCLPEMRRITFRHVGGVTTGMEVEWHFAPHPDGVRVSIHHDFQLDWPLIGSLVAEWIVGRFFVANIAGKTLRRIKLLAESGHRGEGTSRTRQAGEPAAASKPTHRMPPSLSAVVPPSGREGGGIPRRAMSNEQRVGDMGMIAYPISLRALSFPLARVGRSQRHPIHVGRALAMVEV